MIKKYLKKELIIFLFTWVVSFIIFSFTMTYEPIDPDVPVTIIDVIGANLILSFIYAFFIEIIMVVLDFVIIIISLMFNWKELKKEYTTFKSENKNDI